MNMLPYSIIQNIAAMLVVVAFFAIPFFPFEDGHLSELSLFAHAILATAIRKTQGTPTWQTLVGLGVAAFFTVAFCMLWMPYAIDMMDVFPDNFTAVRIISAVALLYHALPLGIYFLTAFIALRIRNLPLILSAPAIYAITVKFFPSVVPCDANIAIIDSTIGQIFISAIGYEFTRYLLATASLILFGYLEPARYRMWIWSVTSSLALAILAATSIASSKETHTQPVMSLVAFQPRYYFEMDNPSDLPRILNEYSVMYSPDAFVFPEGFRQLNFTGDIDDASIYLEGLKKATTTTPPAIIVTERYANTPEDADNVVIVQAELTEGGAIRAYRTKESTLLFAESVPYWINNMKLLKHHVKAISSGEKVFRVNGKLISPLICFELWSDTVVQAAVQENPEALLILSSLNTFGDAVDLTYRQILYQTFLRTKQIALERKIPIAVSILGGGSFAVSASPVQRYSSIRRSFTSFALLRLE